MYTIYIYTIKYNGLCNTHNNMSRQEHILVLICLFCILILIISRLYLICCPIIFADSDDISWSSNFIYNHGVRWVFGHIHPVNLK